MKGKLVEPVEVLRRVGNSELVRYRCFRIQPENKYWVLEAERYQLPLSEEEQKEIAEQSARVLRAVRFGVGDEAWDDLAQTYDTLEEAIMAFEVNYSREGR